MASSRYGKAVEVVTQKLVADAFAGDSMLNVGNSVGHWGSDGAWVGWKSGDDVIVSSSHAGGVPEYHTVASISDDGLTIYLVGALAKAKIGTTISIADEISGLGETTLDGRSTVSLLSRNIEIRGGYNLDYDYISGVGPDLTDYGVTIRLQEAYSELREGWDKTMVGYETYGTFYYPAGFFSNLHWVRFRAAGKQWGLNPPFREPPIVLHTKLRTLRMTGVVVTEPLTGKFFECTKGRKYKGALSTCSTKNTAKTITDSLFVGTAIEFEPARGVTHTIERNDFFGGEECRTDCPPVKMVVFAGAGRLAVRWNFVHGGYGEFTIRAQCWQFNAWDGNVAIGNMVGFNVESGCSSLYKEGYRNSAGIAAATPAVSNFLMVENGIAVTPGSDSWETGPTVEPNKHKDLNGGGAELALISDGVVVGLAPHVDGSVRSADCEKWSGGGSHPWAEGFKLGGSMTEFRWFTEYAYSGFAANGAYVMLQGTGYDDLKTRDIDTGAFSRLGYYGIGGTDTAAFEYVLDNMQFYGFSGTDACGRANVAISNEMAGDGEGTARALGAHFGKATCYPIKVQNSAFPETPDYARLRFSESPTTAEVQWGLCTLTDDGSLFNGTSSEVDPALGPYFLKAGKKHEWPAEVLRDCSVWAGLGYPDDYEGSGTCLWWLRAYENLRPAIMDASKRGLIEAGAPNTQYASGSCDALAFAGNGGAIKNNVQLCRGMEYVLLKTFVPMKTVGGSELLYGPVGYINVKEDLAGSNFFAGEDTVVDIYRDYSDPRADQMPPQTGKEREAFNPVLPRYTQPYLATLVNHGVYRIEYTGDISVFDGGFLEYQLVGLTAEPRLHADFALVVDVKYMKAVKLNFYYDGRQVRASARRDLVSLNAAAGTNYHDPITKVLSFVVKGTQAPVRIKQLEVVQVAFGVAVSFEDFFEDNYLDPKAIDAAYQNRIPPTYAATYDPDFGEIVKTNTFVRNLAAVLNIVPGNRRRLRELAARDPGKWGLWPIARGGGRGEGGRWLDADECLGVDFEISSVDPCDDVVCVHGDCDTEGACACDAGWAGADCNATWVNCSNPTNAAACVPTAVPSAPPSPVPTPPPSASVPPTVPPTVTATAAFQGNNGTNASASAAWPPTPAPTQTALSGIAELLAVAAKLSDAASTGALDTGYTVTEALVALPKDACGVAGGDSSTCADACGVVNGDNSTCADACGVPHGNGTSCFLDAAAGGGRYTCAAGDPATGIVNERQAVALRGAAMTGTWTLSFNGRTTSTLSVYATAESVSAALNALDTVGTVVVNLNSTAPADGSAGVAAVDVLVEFSRETGTYPSHHGRMPLLELDNASLAGVSHSSVARVCNGTYRTGYGMAEQRVVVDASQLGSAGTFDLELAASPNSSYAGAVGLTPAIAHAASAAEFSEALGSMVWSGLPDSTDFEFGREYFEVFAAEESRAGDWTVRFFFAPNSDGLRITEQGDVPLLADGGGSSASAAASASTASVGAPGPSPLLRLGYQGRRRRLDTAAVTVTQVGSGGKGSVPASAMPVSATKAGAASGADAEAEAAAEAAAAGSAEAVTVAEVAHVCGDGSRTTAEACDDGDTADGDGCSGNCTVEMGFLCSSYLTCYWQP